MGKSSTPPNPSLPACKPEAEGWEPPIPLCEVPPAPPFPLMTLPAGLDDFAAEVAQALNCPTDFVAVPMLAVAGGALGNSVRLAITPSHTQPALLFVGAIGHPGSAKSPALDFATAPLQQAELRHHQDYLKALASWQEKPPESRGKPPTPVRCLVDDITTEALSPILRDNPHGLVMVRDELAALVCGLNQYKAGGRGSDRQVFLKLWSQGAFCYDRKRDKDLPVLVHRPFVSILGGIQPAVLARLTREEDGLFDRFLWTYPECPPARADKGLSVSPASAALWDNVVKSLLGLNMMAWFKVG